jgi:hypothetical protein
MHILVFQLISAFEFLCRVQKYQSLVPILSYMNPVRTLTNYFLKMHFNIILPVEIVFKIVLVRSEEIISACSFRKLPQL